MVLGRGAAWVVNAGDDVRRTEPVVDCVCETNLDAGGPGALNGESDLKVVEDDLTLADGGDPDLEDVCIDDATYISKVQTEPYFGAPLRRFIDTASCEFFG